MTRSYLRTPKRLFILKSRHNLHVSNKRGPTRHSAEQRQSVPVKKGDLRVLAGPSTTTTTINHNNQTIIAVSMRVVWLSAESVCHRRVCSEPAESDDPPSAGSPSGSFLNKITQSIGSFPLDCKTLFFRFVAPLNGHKNRPSETTKLSVVLGVLNVSLWESWHLFPCLTRMNPPGVCAIRSRRLKVCREESACWGLKCMRGSGRSSGSYRSFSID